MATGVLHFSRRSTQNTISLSLYHKSVLIVCLYWLHKPFPSLFTSLHTHCQSWSCNRLGWRHSCSVCLAATKESTAQTGVATTSCICTILKNQSRISTILTFVLFSESANTAPLKLCAIRWLRVHKPQRTKGLTHTTQPHPQNQYNPTPHHVYQTTHQDNNTDPVPLGKSLSAHSHTQHLVVPNRSWSVCVFLCAAIACCKIACVFVWCVREIARAL